MFRLADSHEYNQPSSTSPYSQSLDVHFAAFRQDPAVARAVHLRGKNSVGFDAPMNLAAHLTDSLPFRLRRAPTLDARWPAGELDAFVAELNDFATRTHFMDFFEEHRGLYAEAATNLTDRLSGPGYLAWFDSFFGRRPAARVKVVVTMLEIAAAEYTDGRAIRVRFNDGEQGVVDLSQAPWSPMFDPLEDQTEFRRPKVSEVLHTICWENDADLAPEYVCERMVEQRAERLLPGATYPPKAWYKPS